MELEMKQYFPAKNFQMQIQFFLETFFV